MDLLSKVFNDVLKEVRRQEELWGEQNHHPIIYQSFLMEEVGEFSQAVNDATFFNGKSDTVPGDYSNARKEIIQVAAVAISIARCIDMGKFYLDEKE